MKTIGVARIEDRSPLVAKTRTAIYWREKIVSTNAVLTNSELLAKYL
jgi:hypothetical protein